MVKKNQLWRQGKWIFLKMSRYSFIRLFSLFGGWEGCKWETGVEEEWSSSKMKFSIHVDLVSESVCSLFWWRLPSRLLLLCQVRCCLHYWIHSLFWKGFELHYEGLDHFKQLVQWLSVCLQWLLALLPQSGVCASLASSDQFVFFEFSPRHVINCGRTGLHPLRATKHVMEHRAAENYRLQCTLILLLEEIYH